MRWDFRQKRISNEPAHSPHYQNPVFQKKNWQSYIIEKIGLLGWFSILVFLFIIYLLFYSSLLQIKHINITGSSRGTAMNIRDKYVIWQLNQKRWFLFRQNNLFVFSKNWLKQNLEKNYSIQTLSIEKNLPHTLTIDLIEKVPTIVWSSNNKYYYIDEGGKLSNIIEPDKLPVDIPIIIDVSNSEAVPGKKISTDDKMNKILEKLSFLKRLIVEVKKINGLEIVDYSTLSPESYQITVVTKPGYKIYFDFNKSLDNQIENLKKILADTEKVKSIKEYIDLQYGEKIYIK